MGKKLTQEESEKNVIQRCIEKNYKLMENFIYGGRLIKLKLKCNIDNYDWQPTYKNFINNKQGCPKCSGRQKITQEESEKNILEKCKIRNYSVKQFKYENSYTKLSLKCNIDNCEWISTYSNFIYGNKGCPKCAKTLPKNQIDVDLSIIKKCKEMNYTLLKPFIYKNINSILCLKCNNDNHEWNPTYYNFINCKYSCPKCGKNLRTTQNDAEEKIKKICLDNNYTYKSFEYLNNTTEIYLKCSQNHEWSSLYISIVNRHTRCPKCVSINKGKLKRLHQMDAELLIYNKCEKYNYKLLNKDFIYTTSHKTILKLKCNIDGHYWSSTYNNYINLDRCCPLCNNSKGELEIYKYLINKNIFHIREFKFDNCKNIFKLPFDFYLPEYETCIEYDGEQHFKIIEYWGGEKRLNQTKINDKIKTEYCKNNNIKLIRIPYTEIKDINTILDNEMLI